MTPENYDHEIIGIILKAIHGKESEDEKKTLENWLAKSDENKALFTRLYAAAGDKNDEKTAGEAISRLNAAIDGYESASRRYRSLFRRIGLGLSAAAAVAVLALGGLFLSRRLNSGADWQTAANTSAETETVQLEDGSSVFLRPGSSIRYSVGEDAAERQVSLDGDAFFDVAHNAEKPFIVHTKDISVKVLGTMFSVSSRRETSEPTSVILEKGSVKILSPKGEGMVTLKPDQKAVFSSLTGSLDVDELNAKPFLIQKYSLQTIENATLPQIIKVIEAAYGVRIQCEEPVDSRTYNLNYLRTNKVEDIVSIIEIMTGNNLTLQQKTNTINDLKK